MVSALPAERILLLVLQSTEIALLREDHPIFQKSLPYALFGNIDSRTLGLPRSDFTDLIKVKDCHAVAAKIRSPKTIFRPGELARHEKR